MTIKTTYAILIINDFDLLFLVKTHRFILKNKVFMNYIEYEVSGDKHENIRHFVHDIQCRGQFHSRIEIMYVLKGHKRLL